MEVGFNLMKEDKPRQYGSFINLILRDSSKIDSRTCAVSGVVPDCVPGRYILAALSAGTDHDGQQYLNLGGQTITIENDSGDRETIERALNDGPRAE